MIGRRLIVNADDFGMSAGVNTGVVQAHDHGIVTSAGLMVRRPAATEAASLARVRPALSLGLHVDLGEWVHHDGEWSLVDHVVDADDSAGVHDEVTAQLMRFRELTGADPTHLDAHQHLQRDEPARGLLRRVAAELGVPLRLFTSEVRYVGSFYGQWGTGEPLHEAVTVEALQRLIAGLGSGVTELGCHPGLDPELGSVYRAERALEVAALCHPAVGEVIAREDITLCSFREFRRAGDVRPGDTQPEPTPPLPLTAQTPPSTAQTPPSAQR